MSYRELMMAGALALGSCGGLAADGPSFSPESTAGPVVDEGSARRQGLESPDVARSSDESSGAEGAPIVPGVGDPCGPGGDPGERITIGPIVLDASGSCGAGHLCLMWAADIDAACPLAESRGGCEVVDRDDEVVPVPPVLAPRLPAVERVCTCRCDGAGGECVCPEGMSCRELITSSGANGAAAGYVGSYCLY